MLGQSCTTLKEDTDEKRTHEGIHTCETRLAPFDSVSAVPISAISASMSVKVFLSVSLILGDLCVVKIDVRLQRFVLMSVLYCLLKTPFIFFLKKPTNKNERALQHLHQTLGSSAIATFVCRDTCRVITCSQRSNRVTKRPYLFTVSEQVWKNTLQHLFYPIKLLSSSYPDQNFEGNELFNGSSSLEHLCRSILNYLPGHVAPATTRVSQTLLRDNSTSFAC